MTQSTRTLNPLPFEHLEPKRFEDLIRQLAYDFRNWEKLEPTGRAGSDDGFDARGWEIVSDTSSVVEADDDERDDPGSDPVTERRIWLIQCKREKEIGPKKLANYLTGIERSAGRQLYGIILAAPCDFSKQARDVLIAWCARNGLSEWVLWGKADIEDLLYQPKYDHLLFAYFGVSLQIRKRSVGAEVRRQIAIKRKLKRILEAKGRNRPVLLRDPTDIRYPGVDESAPPEKRDHRWLVRTENGRGHQGLKIIVATYFAWVSDDGGQWDMANMYNDGLLHEFDDPWGGQSRSDALREEILSFWQALPDRNRRKVVFFAFLPFDKIIDVDDIGDDVTSHVHIYVLWENGKLPLKGVYVERHGGDEFASRETRVKKFPDNLRAEEVKFF